ncbi:MULTISPECIES: hypothetical protein [Candidatus Cardinium]|uniref:hypothetical protein n=1 Tax=Candidatus Cardinium TaxID=273135 RepID=UPI001FA9C433|nr:MULTISPECIES: hypothetical protein [Cardinium]
MQHSYKAALLYLSVLLFSDFVCSDNKKIKTTQEKSVNNDSNNEKKEIKEQDEATSLNQRNLEEKPEEKKELDTINFDDSQDYEQKKQKAEMDKMKNKLEEYEKKLKETNEEISNLKNLSKDEKEKAAKLSEEKNTIAAKLSEEKNTIIESKKALEKQIYDKQKNMFTGLYDKKAQEVNESYVVDYVNNILTSKNKDRSQQKTLERLLKNQPATAPTKGCMQDIREDKLTIQQAISVFDYIRSDLRAWVLRLPCQAIEKITERLGLLNLPEQLPDLHNACIEQSYLSDSAARKEIKEIINRWIKAEEGLIDEIDYRIKQKKKLSKNKRALKNQLDERRNNLNLRKKQLQLD